MKMTGYNRPEDYTIIIGCGRLGANLAETLSEEGGNVMMVDQDQDAFRKLPASYGGLVMTGDGMDIEVLREAQMENADIVIIVTDNDNANVMTAQIAREIFQVKHVIARLYDPERECVYREFGIETICPTILSANEIDKILSRTGAAIRRGNGTVQADVGQDSAGRGTAIGHRSRPMQVKGELK